MQQGWLVFQHRQGSSGRRPQGVKGLHIVRAGSCSSIVKDPAVCGLRALKACTSSGLARVPASSRIQRCAASGRKRPFSFVFGLARVPVFGMLYVYSSHSQECAEVGQLQGGDSSP